MHGFKVGLEVENEPLQIFGGGTQVSILIVTASLIVKSRNDDIAVYGFATAGSVLENSFGLGKKDQCFLSEVFVYEFFRFQVVRDEFLHEFI